MENIQKYSKNQGRRILLILIAFGILIWCLALIFGWKVGEIKAKSLALYMNLPSENSLSMTQGNSIMAKTWPDQPNKTIKMTLTAYSSTVWQTDDTPFTTASGKTVADGIVANNLLPFGTKIRIPDLYGNKVFVVEDRMNYRKSKYHLDIWFPEYAQALNFGAKTASIEVL